MKRTREELSISMVVLRFIFQNNLITLLSSFASMPKTRTGLPEGIFLLCSIDVAGRTLLEKKSKFGLPPPPFYFHPKNR